MKKKPEVTKVRMAGEDHAVLTVEGGSGLYRRSPCEECPWRKDKAGTFPAEAFKHSAGTAYDMATSTFACHMSGAEKPACCAGFLMRGAEHNLMVRMGMASGKYDLRQVSDGGLELFDGYREMAIANGVHEDDEVLKPCR